MPLAGSACIGRNLHADLNVSSVNHHQQEMLLVTCHACWNRMHGSNAVFHSNQ
jgi:hypothetical protein